MKETFLRVTFTLLLLMIVLPNICLSQVYLFPDWIVDELLEQNIPLYTRTPGTWTADVRSHEFKWIIEASGRTHFTVSGTGVEFHGSNADYAQYVLGVNWLGLFGSFPGGGLTANSTILGESIEDMSDIVLVMPGKPDQQTESISSGLEYESSQYHSQDIGGITIPINYTKPLADNRTLGLNGKINYASTSGAKKYYFHLAPYYKKPIKENIEVGGICNISLVTGSIDRFDMPTVTVFGFGGFVTLQKNIGKAKTKLAVIVEPKYGDGAFNLPFIYGFKGWYPVSRVANISLELIGGFEPVSATDNDSFGKFDTRIDFLGLYSFGYKKNINTGNYKNSILYANFRKFF